MLYNKEAPRVLPFWMGRILQGCPSYGWCKRVREGSLGEARYTFSTRTVWRSCGKCSWSHAG